MPTWLYDQAEVVVAIVCALGGAVWSIGRTVGMLSTKVEEGFAMNHRDHNRIIDKLDDHTERITAVETKIVDMRGES